MFSRSKPPPGDRSGAARAPIETAPGVPDDQTGLIPEGMLDHSKAWPPDRIKIVEKLWGEGCLTPESGDFVIDAVRPIELNESRSLLQFGAGLGGVTRALAGVLGVWVTALEAVPEIAELGQHRSTMAGMTRKASIKRYDPADPKLKERSYDAAIAFEEFYRIEEKETLLEAIQNALRVDGHLMIIDFVLPSSDPPNDVVRRWFESEPERPHLWTAKQMYDAINGLQFDVRIAEDFTDQYRGMVLRGWLDFITNLTNEIKSTDAVTVIQECKYWLYRVAALESEGLRVYRYHAIREKPPREMPKMPD